MIRVLHGDCRDVLRTLGAESVHAVVTDPPYGLEFMGVAWDTFDRPKGRERPRNEWGDFGSREHPRHQREAARIARNKSRAFEDWSFAWATEVFRVMKPGAHLAAFGGTRTFHRMACAIEDAGFEVRDCLSWLYGSGFPKSHNQDGEWAGWGTALKPAWEPIILARKPLRGTVAANVQAHGCGAINVDACRVATGENRARMNNARTGGTSYVVQRETKLIEPSALGRWPANVCHDGSDEVEAAFAAFGERTSGQPCGTKTGGQGNAFGHFGGGIPVTGIGDTGSASRFFFCGKATAEDRAGSKHPTVKPLALMDWLVKLITPPGGTVLDPFAGSGTTLLAADRLGFNAIGIEQDAEYVADIHRRLQGDCPLFAEVTP